MSCAKQSLMRFILITSLLTLSTLMPLTSLAEWTKLSEDSLKVKFGLSTPRYTFSLKPSESMKSDSEVRFEPNSSSRTALGLTYRSIGLSAFVSNPKPQDEETLFGRSNSTDLQFRFFGKRTYEFIYQAYSGFYIENSEQLDKSFINTPRKIIRSDVSTHNYTFNFSWNLHENDFSQAVAFDQSGTQKSSGWGVSMFFHLSDSEVSGNSALVPSATSSLYGDLAGLTSLQRYTLSVGPMIGGIYTHSRFYLASTFGMGPSLQLAEAQYEGKRTEHFTSSELTNQVRFSTGYDGVHHGISFQVFVESLSTKLDDGSIKTSSTDGSLFYSYRFEGVNILPANRISQAFD